MRQNLATYAPATAELAILSTFVAVVVGVSFGVAAAVRRNRFHRPHAARRLARRHLHADPSGSRSSRSTCSSTASVGSPAATGWIPASSRRRTRPGCTPSTALLAGQWSTAWDAFHHLILPALVLAAFSVGLLTRYTRSAVLEVIGNDYVQAARAKGLPEANVLRRHVLRAALPSVVTVIGLVFANVLTGTVLVETIFAWPGIGQYAYRSAVTLDLPAIMGVSLFVAVVYITINFVVDVLYGVIDPRIRVT